MAFAIKAPPETVTHSKLLFALVLRDGFADSDELLGEITVAGGGVKGKQKDSSGAFLFYKLQPGAQDISVDSSDDTPYYLPAKVGVTIPVPQPAPPVPQYPWPIFPDVRLADPDLPLGDPGQPAAYRNQRTAATLWPSIAYPFPEGTTLVRGTVTHGGPGHPMSRATVQRTGSTDPAFTTDSNGQFVLYWQQAPGIPQKITLKVAAAGLGSRNVDVVVNRGLTNLIDIDL